MNVVYRFRIYPNKIQQELFAKTFGCVRFVYNRMLAEKKECYEKTGKNLKVTPAKYKAEFPWLKEVDSLAPVSYTHLDVYKRHAYIRSNVSGEVKDYEIEIQKVDYGSIQKNKGLVLRVVDEELLNLTSGIVQGMSGSPIIQDGKLIGAVTHVFINDPTRGYGIFAENMISH